MALLLLAPKKIESFIGNLPVEKFHGVGKVTAARMKSLDLYTGYDLKKLSQDDLVKYFGKAGHFYYQIVRGIDNRAVELNRETKSVGAEDTFAEDLTNVADMEEQLEPIAALVVERLQKKSLKGKTVTLKIKYSDFVSITRSRSLAQPVNDIANILAIAKQLLQDTTPIDVKVRLLGITVSNFAEGVLAKANNRSGQLQLFPSQAFTDLA